MLCVCVYSDVHVSSLYTYIHQSNNHFELKNIHGAACHPSLNTSSFCCHSIHVMNTHRRVCVYVRQMTPRHIKVNYVRSI